MKAHDVAKGALAKLHGSQAHLGPEKVWRDTLNEIEGVFIGPLSVKQRSQLKLFRKRCPENHAAAVLEYILWH